MHLTSKFPPSWNTWWEANFLDLKHTMYTVRYLLLVRFFHALPKLQHILQALGFPHIYAIAPLLGGFWKIAKTSIVSTNDPRYKRYTYISFFALANFYCNVLQSCGQSYFVNVLFNLFVNISSLCNASCVHVPLTTHTTCIPVSVF